MQPLAWVILGLVALGVVSPPVLIALLVKERRRRATAEARTVSLTDEVETFRKRFPEPFNLDAEILRLRTEIESIERERSSLSSKYQSEHAEQERLIAEIRAQYAEKKTVYDRLRAEVAIFDERLAFAEMGVYEPHFDFSDSDKFKAEIAKIRERQKTLVDAKKAVTCAIKWSLDGDAKKGQVMTDRSIRLTTRAFNNECEAAISNARWNNVNAMEKRITKAKEQIDKLNASNQIVISADFLASKLRELYLTHEYREKLKHERDERLEATRLQKEEQRLLRDKEEAEAEAGRYAKLLAKAQTEAAKSVGTKLDAYTAQIAILEKDLAEAESNAARAQALAEQTRSGYVYIISNIGSFGEGVVKIGMTRRLDPLDRVRELGSASVPFTFDVHGIIYSEDAPKLEHALHSEFASCRVNTQNFRKEFFRTEIDRVATTVKKLAPNAAFITDVEAQEYRETLSRRQALLEADANSKADAFPATI